MDHYATIGIVCFFMPLSFLILQKKKAALLSVTSLTIHVHKKDEWSKCCISMIWFMFRIMQIPRQTEINKDADGKTRAAFYRKIFVLIKYIVKKKKKSLLNSQTNIVLNIILIRYACGTFSDSSGLFLFFIYSSGEVELLLKMLFSVELANKVLLGIQFLQKLSPDVPIIPSSIYFVKLFEAFFFSPVQRDTIIVHTLTLLEGALLVTWDTNM